MQQTSTFKTFINKIVEIWQIVYIKVYWPIRMKYAQLLLLLIVFLCTSFPIAFALTYPLTNNLSQTVAFVESSIGFKSLVTNAGAQSSSVLTLAKLDGEPINRYVLARKVYQYVTLESSTSYVKPFVNVITFYVPTSWLTEFDIPPTQMRLFYYNQTWLESNTTVEAGENGYTYTASAPIFGYFAIARADVAPPQIRPVVSVEKKEEAVYDTVVDKTVYPLPKATLVEANSQVLTIAIGVVTFVLILIVVFIYVWQKRKAKPVIIDRVALDAARLIEGVTKHDSHLAAMLHSIQEKYKVPTMALSVIPPSSKAVALVAAPVESVIELADKITQLEESVVKKFMHAAKVQMLDAQTVRANLLTHGVRPEIIELAIDEYLR